MTAAAQNVAEQRIWSGHWNSALQKEKAGLKSGLYQNNKRNIRALAIRAACRDGALGLGGRRQACCWGRWL
jgi:hypothetical protein